MVFASDNSDVGDTISGTLTEKEANEKVIVWLRVQPDSAFVLMGRVVELNGRKQVVTGEWGQFQGSKKLQCDTHEIWLLRRDSGRVVVECHYYDHRRRSPCRRQGYKRVVKPGIYMATFRRCCRAPEPSPE